MSWIPVAAERWVERQSVANNLLAARIPQRLVIAGFVLRTLFIVSLLIMTVHVSMPQSSTIWTVFETPSDLIRLVLGFVVCLWVAFQLFALPKDIEAYRTWLYLGLAAVPFTLICIVGIW